MIKQFENEHVRLERTKGIIKVTYSVEHMTLPIARECVRDRIWMFSDTLFLVDHSSIKTLDRDASKYLASKAAFQGISKCALLTDKLLLKLVFNLYFSIIKQPSSVKYFTSEEDGVKWLHD